MAHTIAKMIYKPEGDQRVYVCPICGKENRPAAGEYVGYRFYCNGTDVEASEDAEEPDAVPGETPDAA